MQRIYRLISHLKYLTRQKLPKNRGNKDLIIPLYLIGILTELIFRKMKSVYELFPKIVECNICGWSGRHFQSDEYHPYTRCPECHLFLRHRLLLASLTYIDQVSYENIIKGKRLLHFAPEDVLASILQGYALQYVTADFRREDVDIKLDISNMYQIENNSFDTVIACDVLEHVENDIQALYEIYRILSDGGYAILIVPQKDNLEKTFHNPKVMDPDARKRMFGARDHLRIYGNDFSELLEMIGFKVTVVNESDFSHNIVKRNVLFPPVLSEDPAATNYRKVFFAKKM